MTAQAQLAYFCPTYNCRFMSDNACKLRRERSGRNYLPGTKALYDNPYSQCVDCKTGPEKIEADTYYARKKEGRVGPMGAPKNDVMTTKYGIENMAFGQSKIIPCPEESNLMLHQRNIFGRAAGVAKRYGRKFKTHQVPGGVKVTRIA